MRRSALLAALLAGPVLALSTALPAQAVARSSPDGCAQTDGRVVDIEISGGTVYIGGTFTSATAPDGTVVSRRNAFAIDAATCRVLPWDPGVEGEVMSVAVDGGTVYLGGLFTAVAGKRRKNLAAVDATSGALTSFAPLVRGYVGSLQVANGRLYAGGGVASVDGQSRTRAAAFSLATGSLDGQWTPLLDKQVKALTVSPDGSRVYLGGTFGGTTPSLVAVDPVTGTVLSSFSPSPRVPTNDIEVTSDRVIAGVAGRGGRAIVYDLTGRRLGYHQSDGNMQAVALDGDDLYVAGHFNSYCTSGSPCPDGDVLRRKAFAVSLSGGQLSSFDPNFDSAMGVWAMEFDQHTGRLFVGGDFTSARGGSVLHLAMFDVRRVS